MLIAVSIVTQVIKRFQEKKTGYYSQDFHKKDRNKVLNLQCNALTSLVHFTVQLHKVDQGCKCIALEVNPLFPNYPVSLKQGSQHMHTYFLHVCVLATTFTNRESSRVKPHTSGKNCHALVKKVYNKAMQSFDRILKMSTLNEDYLGEIFCTKIYQMSKKRITACRHLCICLNIELQRELQ